MFIQPIEDRNIGHINFDDNQISLIERDNELFVPLKPICIALGLEWENHRRNIQEDVVLSSTTITMMAVGQDNKQREMLCLPLSHLDGWLFKINPARYEGERREKIIKYQKECYKALFEHFYPHTKKTAGLLDNQTEANKREVAWVKSTLALEEQAENAADKVYKGQKTLGDFSLSPRLQSMIRKKVEALNKDSLFPANPEGGEI
jgi:hypothetical protein